MSYSQLIALTDLSILCVCVCAYVCLCQVLKYWYPRGNKKSKYLSKNCFTQENITLILNNSRSVVPSEKTFYLLFNAVHQDDKKIVQHVRICPVCSVQKKKN